MRIFRRPRLRALATSSGAARRSQVFGSALMLGALVLWMFPRPAAAAVTGTATPNTGLGTIGMLKVTGSGFATGDLRTVYVLECERGATDSSQCDANTGDGSLNSNTSGNYTNNAYVYYELPNDAFGGVDSITCDATHLCDLVLIQDDYNNFSNPHVNIPISFAGSVVTTTTGPTTTTSSTTTSTSTSTTMPTTTTSSTTSTTTSTMPSTTTTSTTSTTVPVTTTTGSTTTTSTTAPATTTTTTTSPVSTSTTTTAASTTTTTTTTPPTSTTTTGSTTSTSAPGSTTTTTEPSQNCRPVFGYGHFDRCSCQPQHHSWRGDWSLRFCKPGHGSRHESECPCAPPEHGPHDRGFGSQGVPGAPGHQASDAGYYGEKLPEQGVPAAVPLMALCGFVILLGGTVLRRIVLRVPA